MVSLYKNILEWKEQVKSHSFNCLTPWTLYYFLLEKKIKQEWVDTKNVCACPTCLKSIILECRNSDCKRIRIQKQKRCISGHIAFEDDEICTGQDETPRIEYMKELGVEHWYDV
jgi:hypothetical protein